MYKISSKFILTSVIISVLVLISASFAQNNPPAVNNVTAIEVTGNTTVSLAKMLTQIKTRVNTVYNPNVISDDIKRLYALGFFDRVWVEEERSEGGIKVIFQVLEKPLLRNVIFAGSRQVHPKKLEKEIDLKKGSTIDDRIMKNAADKIKELYVKRGYSHVDVKTALERDEKSNEADLTITVDAGPVNKIGNVDIQGNMVFKKRKLRALLKTKAKWLFFSGILKEDVIKDDVKRLEDFYKVNGYEDVVVEYAVNAGQGTLLTVVFSVKEGKQYITGTISIEGTKNIPQETVRSTLTMTEQKVFSKKQLREDMINMQTLYFNKGYIYVQVSPVTALNMNTDKVDITYTIKENEIAYVNMIDIRGNQRTKDKVIRRELKLNPGDQFDGEKLKRSRERLERLGYFEEIRFDTQHSSKPNWEDLTVDVKEAKTGTFSFGGGYSSVDQLVGFIELRQRNFDYKNFPYFVGAGQDVSVQMSIGSLTENYEISFTNPWIFDRPISFGFDGYKREHERETDVGYGYDESISGGDIRFGKDFNDYLKANIGFRVEQVEISNVSAGATNDLKEEEGTSTVNSIEVGLSYDRRDNVFFPLKGYYLTLSEKTAGFGGDKSFVQVSLRESFYFPLLKRSVLELRLRQGVATPYDSTNKIPIYERFFAGGAYTIRGYGERMIGPIDTLTEDPLGGESMFIANLEYTYPLADFLKIAFFFDTGNVWEKASDFCSTGFKSSFGLGLRVKTPFGPINLDYGIPLDKEPGESEKGDGRFHFSVSRGF